nr:NADH dehydrogenase subunit 1 [Haematopinus apri]
MMIVTLVQMLFTIMSIFIAVAFFSLLERKMLSISQNREGPNKIVLKGFSQPIGDAIKLLSKSTSLPNLGFYSVYTLGPLALLSINTFLWITTPFLSKFVYFNHSGMVMLLILSVTALPTIYSGWFSNSTFSTMGAIRSVAQSLSFEITFSFSLFISFLMIQSLCLENLPKFQSWSWLFWCIPWISLVTLICFLAESGRSPFDLPEGESELVSGYTIEFGGLHYTLIFLGENLAVMFMTMIFSTTYLGGFSLWKASMLVMIIVMIRSSYPRIRYDQLMQLNWVGILPQLISSVWIISILS